MVEGFRKGVGGWDVPPGLSGEANWVCECFILNAFWVVLNVVVRNPDSDPGWWRRERFEMMDDVDWRRCALGIGVVIG